MHEYMVHHPALFLILAGIAGLAAWELAAHCFLSACGMTGAASWSWWVRPIVEALA